MSDKLYSIGEVSKICNISKKTLRYYDKIDLISPDTISSETNYRYYDKDTLLFVPVIKYYKQMGFKLEDMKELLEGDSYDIHISRFKDKIDELTRQRESIDISYRSVKEWYNLILEADNVLRYRVNNVSVKYIEKFTAPCMRQTFSGNYKDAIINIPWTNNLENLNQAIYGPVYLYFPRIREKLEGLTTECTVFQKNAREIEDGDSITVGGQLMLTAYHIGRHEEIGETYRRMYEWAEEHGYMCSDSSIERYVTDYWTISNSEDFVTEVMIGLL